MKTNVNDLISHVKKHIELNTNYAYGSKGKILTEIFFDWTLKTYPNMVPESDRKKIGTYCHDCSGMISSLTGIQRNSGSYFTSADEVIKAPFSLGKEHIGWGVYKPGHIGVYLGDGYVGEAKSSRDNTVKSKLSDTKWTYAIKLCDVEYGVVEDTVSERYTYEVQKGDTLIRIARSFQVDVEELYDLNKSKYEKMTKDFIQVGWLLDIPGNDFNFKPDSGYGMPGNYVLLDTMRVRDGAGIYATVKKKSELSLDGQKNSNSNGSLLKGTIVTASEVIENESECTMWLKIPSGYVCLYDTGTYYATRL